MKLPSAFTLKKISKFSNISKKEWDNIFTIDTEATIYQSFSWNYNFFNTFQKRHSLNLYLIYNNKKLISIFPLIERKIKTKSVLEFIGSRMVDYLQPICNDTKKLEIYEFFLSFIYENKFNLYIYDIKEDHSFCKFLKEKGFIFKKTIDSCILYKKDPLTFNLKENNYNLRYLGRRENFEILGTDDKLTHYEHSKNFLKQMNKRFYYKIKLYHLKFWKNCINLMDFKLKSIKINGEVAYSILYVIRKNTVYLINFYFNETYRKYSPGKILLNNIIFNYHKDYNIDFSRGAENYKLKYGCRSESNLSILLPRNKNLESLIKNIDTRIGFFPTKS